VTKASHHRKHLKKSMITEAARKDRFWKLGDGLGKEGGGPGEEREGSNTGMGRSVIWPGMTRSPGAENEARWR